MNYKDFTLGDWIGHISRVIEDESELDGNEMRDLVEFLSKLPMWIPVSERLPDTNETVLCWYEYYHWSLEKVLPEYGLGYYFKEVGTWGGEVANGLKAKVLAWQPLPKPYEEKRGVLNGSN